jgi:hypothetical protein
MQFTTWELPNSAAQLGRLGRIGETGFTGPLRHCVTTAIELRGPAVPDELRTRMSQLVRHRPALGGTFGPRTHRLLGGEPSLRHHVVTGPDPEARWRAARDLADFEAQRPFTLGEHPLVRGLLLTADPDRHLFVVTLDQLVSDAWSANLVLDDLLSTDAVAGPDAYSAVWREREEWLAGPEGSAAVARRRRHLGDAELRWALPTEAEPDLLAPLVDRFVALDDRVSDALLAQVRQSRGTLLAAGAMALAAVTAGTDRPLALRTTLAGRERTEEHDVVGWFANEGVLRLPPRSGTVLEYARALRTEIFGALADQRIPYDLVGDALRPGAAGGLSVALVFLPGSLIGGGEPPRRLGAAVAGRAGVSICPTGADIDFFLLENAPPMSTTPRAALTAGVLASPQTAGPEAIGRLLRHWTDALAALAAAPWAQTRIDELARAVAGACSRD